MENESVTLAAVSKRQERLDSGNRIGDTESRIENSDIRIEDTRSRIRGSGSIRGLAVSLTPVRLESWMLFLVSFIAVIR